MTTLTKSLLGAALTVPLVAFVAGVLAAPEPVQDDRSRPVIIGRVSEDDTEPQQDHHQPDDNRDRDPAGSGGDDTEGGAGDPTGGSAGGPADGPTDDRSGEGPAAPITPAPRYLDDDDDGGHDDGGDDDDGDTDDSSGGDD